jgi:hypothetical protein
VLTEVLKGKVAFPTSLSAAKGTNGVVEARLILDARMSSARTGDAAKIPYFSEQVMIIREHTFDEFKCEGFMKVIKFQKVRLFRICQ